MRAAVYGPGGAISVEEVPVPEPDAGEALIEVRYCGICGTDLHDGVDGWAPPGTIGGHEWAGTVVAGAGEPDTPNEGAVVTGLLVSPCGSCDLCRQGRGSLCRHRPSPGLDRPPGAFAEFVAVPADRLVTVPDGVDVRSAAFAEPLAVALHAIDRADLDVGSRAMVFGAGPIGAAVLAGLRARGVDDLVAVEPDPGRAALAEQLGADVTHPDDLTVPAMPDDLSPHAADAVFECSGVRAAVEAAQTQVGRTGTLVLVGTGLDQPALDTNRVVLQELVVTGAFTYSDGGLTEAVDLLASGRIPTDLLIEDESVGLEDLAETMRRLRAGELAGKVMVEL